MMRVEARKLLWSALVGVLLAIMYTGVVDEAARDYTEQGFRRVLATYAVARGLNGVISVVQGTEVSVEPAGVGMTFTPGQILDPVNDLVEQFSWLVLASGVSLGIQRLLINMTSGGGFTLLVSVMLVTAVVFHNWKQIPLAVSRVVARIALVLVVLRLAVPVIALLDQAVYWYFLQPQYEFSQAALERSDAELKQQPVAEKLPAMSQDEAMLDKLKRIYQSASDAVDMDARLDRIKQVATEMSERILDLMVVFIVQSLLLPLLFLWLFYRLALRLFHMV
ncbi:MAG: hypothetical protein QG652_564 [Pseudomonadota bacterium]|nr:hypothetical protein [Pseudomonadota bacterium]